MHEATVYFTDFRTRPGRHILKKLRDLLFTAGIDKIDFGNKMVAIKIHFGEPGNLAYIRPNYAAEVAAIIKELGGQPFLTDANTLYSGLRSNAIDHLNTAMQNGFSPLTVGCPVIIADGLKGIEFREIPIHQKHCRTAKIGSAIADADIIISLNHFKGHDLTGFGGAIKNVGMGSGSRGGKMEMHSSSKPRIVGECTACGICIESCSQQALALSAEDQATIDYDICIGCGQCIALCRFNAVQVVWGQSAEVTTQKIVEYALAVLQGKPSFHINIIASVSPNCDCWSHNDVPIVSDLGMAASFDPVALDKASVDMVNKAPLLSASLLGEKGCQPGDDKFTLIYPQTSWQDGLEYAQKIGLGSIHYELVVKTW
jgi:uncharacterized Fe-S center protein